MVSTNLEEELLRLLRPLVLPLAPSPRVSTAASGAAVAAVAAGVHGVHRAAGVPADAVSPSLLPMSAEDLCVSFLRFLIKPAN